MEKIYQANIPPKQAGVAKTISDKVDLKPKLIRGDKEKYMKFLYKN
jgi:hypothetical protein